MKEEFNKTMENLREKKKTKTPGNKNFLKSNKKIQEKAVFSV
jgi:hypothetical protein